MKKTMIRVDEETWKAIRKASMLGETHNETIKRVLWIRRTENGIVLTDLEYREVMKHRALKDSGSSPLNKKDKLVEQQVEELAKKYERKVPDLRNRLYEIMQDTVMGPKGAFSVLEREVVGYDKANGGRH